MSTFKQSSSVLNEVSIISFVSFQVSWPLFWFYIGIGSWIYQMCPERYRTLHRTSSRVDCIYIEIGKILK